MNIKHSKIYKTLTQSISTITDCLIDTKRLCEVKRSRKLIFARTSTKNQNWFAVFDMKRCMILSSNLVQPLVSSIYRILLRLLTSKWSINYERNVVAHYIGLAKYLKVAHFASSWNWWCDHTPIHLYDSEHFSVDVYINVTWLCPCHTKKRFILLNCIYTINIYYHDSTVISK